MLQYLRAGDSTFLINMANQYNRNSTGLGKTQQSTGTLSDLRHTARCRVNGFRLHGLDRVYYDKIRSRHTYLVKHFLYAGLTQHRHSIIHAPFYAFCPHSYLMGTLLTAYIQHIPLWHTHNCLQRKCTLADAWITAQQHYAAGHQSTAKHAVQFGIIHIHTR